MNVQIYGLQALFTSAGNWFTSIYSALLMLLIAGLCVYAFIKINFTKHQYLMNGFHHYGLNGGVFAVFFIMLFWLGNYINDVGVVYSTIFTILFYGVSIFVLTVALIILRRYKIKQYLIESAIWLNNNKEYKWTENSKNKIYIMRSQCVDADHKYSDWLFKEIEKKRMNGKKEVIDTKFYESINIFKDENYVIE